MELRPQARLESATAFEAGQEALERGAWEEARSALEQALLTGESPEASFGLGQALWWLGEIRESVRCWERAYVAFRRRPDPVQAVNVALQLGFVYQANLGNHAAASGWAAHAARLVDDFGLEPLQGWVSLLEASGCSDSCQGETLAREARQMAFEAGDRDLELCALSQIGGALIEQGRIDEGVPLIDEAMAGALAGEGQLDTVVFTSCQMIHSCNRCADFQRVVQWVRAADRFMESYGCPYLDATCRAHYGGVLFATGDWPRAEEELQAALDLSGDAQPVVRGEALARLAELRLAQGRIEEAELLLAGFEDHEAALPVCTRIQLLRGKPSLA
ncbi:MAG: helix-turn-helix transcriptional regulator, partial [Rubrobacter sp.]